jgi:hypothetical protein
VLHQEHDESSLTYPIVTKIKQAFARGSLICETTIPHQVPPMWSNYFTWICITYYLGIIFFVFDHAQKLHVSKSKTILKGSYNEIQ